ncbi:MAG: hypothetical protein WKG32_10535 [Gemmatimonadaceae bacterium]
MQCDAGPRHLSSELDELRDQADEAAMSRLYGGIHYRFDSDVGLRMGRAIAALAVAAERARGATPFFRVGRAGMLASGGQ